MSNKIKNGNLSAFAAVCDNTNPYLQEGLTKREYFAAMAMQGLLVNYIENGMYGNSTGYPMVAEQSVMIADQLLKQLENEQ